MDKILSFFRALREIRLNPDERTAIQKQIFEEIKMITVTSTETARQQEHMGESFESFFRAVRSDQDHLKADEKAAMYRALDTEIKKSSAKVPQRDPWSILDLFTSLRTVPALAAVMILVIGTGGVAAAENSLPGDTWYLVKLNVTEPVLSVFHRTPEAKTKWEMRLAERRLEEAEELSIEDRLDTDLEGSIALRFKDHTERVEKLLKDLPTEVATQISANYESALAAHYSVLVASAPPTAPLADVSEQAASRTMKTGVMMMQMESVNDADASVSIPAAIPQPAGPLRVTLREAVKNLREGTVKLEDSGEGIKVVTEGSVKNAEDKISEVRTSIKKEVDEGRIDVSASAEINTRLDAAEAALSEAKVKIDSGEFNRAFTDVKSTLRSAEEAKLMLKNEGVRATSRVKVNVNVRTNSDDEKSSASSASSTQSSQTQLNLDQGSNISASANVHVEQNSDDGSNHVEVKSESKVKVNISF